MSKNLPYIKGISKKLWHAFLSEKIRCIYNTESTFCNYFVNRNIEQIQKRKTISFMKMAAVIGCNIN